MSKRLRRRLAISSSPCRRETAPIASRVRNTVLILLFVLTRRMNALKSSLKKSTADKSKVSEGQKKVQDSVQGLQVRLHAGLRSYVLPLTASRWVICSKSFFLNDCICCCCSEVCVQAIQVKICSARVAAFRST